MQHSDPVREAGRLLSEGAILAIKGYGGFHVAASAVKDKPLLALRKSKYRRAKPFAVMVRSLEAAETFAEVTATEKALLASYARPIVLLNKNSHFTLSPLVAPDLHNIGVMLPYTGLHYMLFDRVGDAAFVMTSANPPNQPIVKDNDEALKTLGDTVDYFLFHNRKIAHRCDDSVTRVHGNRNVFIRRSRGYAPAPIMLKEKAKRCVVGLGGELNNTACVLLGNKAFISQHIGDVENLETKTFLQEATNHLIRLTNSNVDAVACDLHPKFTTTSSGAGTRRSQRLATNPSAASPRAHCSVNDGTRRGRDDRHRLRRLRLRRKRRSMGRRNPPRHTRLSRLQTLGASGAAAATRRRRGNPLSPAHRSSNTQQENRRCTVASAERWALASRRNRSKTPTPPAQSKPAAQLKPQVAAES